MNVMTKEELIAKLQYARSLGWVANTRPGNAGGVGNTLEDLTGLPENNLPLPNSGEWELKARREGSTSLMTLFHVEPSPRALNLVPSTLLPNYGWPHQQAGVRYPMTELSFRQTIHACARSDRGFGVTVDHKTQRVLVSFDASSVSKRHSDWLASVATKTGLSEISPQPYWGFDELEHTAGAKLNRCAYVLAAVKREQGREFFWFQRILMMAGFSFSGLLNALETGNLCVDFDARTGHNHGTKFRLRERARPMLYSSITEV